MILKKEELFLKIDSKPLRLASLAIRLIFIYHILWPLRQLPLGPNTSSLLPISDVLNFFSVSAYHFLFPLFQNNYQLIGIILIALSFLKKLERVSFFILSVFSFIFIERFFLISHIADYFYTFIFFHLALLPSFEKNGEINLRVIDLLPLFLLRTIIYGFNIFQKIETWGPGNGLSQSLRHSELSQFSTLPAEFPILISILNYLLILVLMITLAFPFISYAKESLRFRLSLVCVGYHLGGLFLFNLDGISLPFILLEIMLWGTLLNPSKATVEAQSHKIHNRTWIAVIILVLGFFNVATRGNHFDRLFNLPMGHNWYMFAPPPPVSAGWQISVTDSHGNQKTLSQNEWAKELKIPSGIRSYKYFYNLRRIDSFVFVEDLMKTSCAALSARSIKTKYSGTILEINEPFEKSWPAYACD